jgi:glycosyltransferase involved in cell wall biosynthesis
VSKSQTEPELEETVRDLQLRRVMTELSHTLTVLEDEQRNAFNAQRAAAGKPSLPKLLKGGARRSLRAGQQAFRILAGLASTAIPRHVRQRLEAIVMERSSAVDLLKAMPRARARRSEAEIVAVRGLLEALGNNFGKSAAERLRSMQSGRELDQAVGDVAWGLACWCRSQGQYEEALHQLALRRLTVPNAGYEPTQAAVEADCLLGLRAPERARRLVEEAVGYHGEAAMLWLTAANVLASDQTLPRAGANSIRLRWLSNVFVRAGLLPLGLEDAAQTLNFSNLTTSFPLRQPGDIKVSVLMTTQNSEATVDAAIGSLVKQTWNNIELIVVDCGSDDGTWDIVSSHANRDPRIKAIKPPKACTPNAARRLALEQSTGAFVTLNEAHDWSHSQRLECQVTQLQKSEASFNTVSHMRVAQDMRVQFDVPSTMIEVLARSLIAKREDVLALGGWDDAMGADDEFYERFLASQNSKPSQVHEAVPLVVSLEPLDPPSGYAAAREYAEAYRYWQALEAKRPGPRFRLPAKGRAFPVPPACLGRARKVRDYDILWVGDFSRGEGLGNVLALPEGSAALDARSACFHWPRIAAAAAPIETRMRRVLHEGIADAVVAGERVRCKLAVVTDASILQDLPDFLPGIEAGNVVVLVGGVPETGGLAKAMTNAKQAFGKTPIFAPTSEAAREALGTAVPPEQLAAADWPPFAVELPPERPEPRRDRARAPRIGYEDGRRRATVSRLPFMGSQAAEDGFRPKPDWVPISGTGDEAGALDGLDILVCHPGKDAPGGVSILQSEALAAGIPVILPPHFEAILGDAASYADVDGLEDALQALWGDKGLYEAKAAAGRAFARENCSLARLKERLSPYLKKPTKRRA